MYFRGIKKGDEVGWKKSKSNTNRQCASNDQKQNSDYGGFFYSCCSRHWRIGD